MRSRKSDETPAKQYRRFTDEFEDEAEQMLLDEHSDEIGGKLASAVEPEVALLSEARSDQPSGSVADTLESRVRELEHELVRVERERDILKMALSILSRSG